MKTLKLSGSIVLSAVAGCLFLLSQLRAADSPDTRPTKEEIRQQIARYDVDKNGYLDTKERQALLHEAALKTEARREAQLEAARAAGIIKAGPNRTEVLKQFDTNGNGFLDASEWKNYRRDQQRIRAEKSVSGQATNVVAAPRLPQP